MNIRRYLIGAAVNAAFCAACSMDRTVQPAQSAVRSTDLTAVAEVMRANRGHFATGVDTTALAALLSAAAPENRAYIARIYTRTDIAGIRFDNDARLNELAMAVFRQHTTVRERSRP